MSDKKAHDYNPGVYYELYNHGVKASGVVDRWKLDYGFQNLEEK